MRSLKLVVTGALSAPCKLSLIHIFVGQSLEKLAHGRTTLTIAHRLTTIKYYDRILVLGAEGVEESGTHDELLAKKGVYYRLWNQLPGEDTL